MKNKKSSIVKLFIIVAIAAILVLGYYIYTVNIEREAKMKKAAELQTEANNLSETASRLQDNLNSVYSTNKELTSSAKQELFENVVMNNIVFIDDMINVKDFTKKGFTDTEILLMLPDSTEGKIFSSYYELPGFYSIASISDIQKSSQKLFNKTIDVKNTQNNNAVIFNDDSVIVQVRSGLGAADAELLSVNSLGNNRFLIEFKYISGTEETYKLTVSYIDGEIVYENLEK